MEVDEGELENQRIDVPEVIEALRTAAVRGLEIVAVVPAEDRHAPGLLALAEHERFTLVALTGRALDGTRHPVWVHSRLMIVDDAWFTVGSANLHRFSLTGNAELNLAIWDPPTTRALRYALTAEHLGETCRAPATQFAWWPTLPSMVRPPSTSSSAPVT